MARPNFDQWNSAHKAPDFHAPTQAPAGESDAARWQEANKAWWESSPMRYDWREAIAALPGSREYFEEVDRRFLSAVAHYLPWKSKPFESLIPYQDLAGKDVLEIGVGQGTHAQLIAPHCRSYVGIDLTETASAATRTRLALHGIPAQVFQMDAEVPDGLTRFMTGPLRLGTLLTVSMRRL